MIAWINILDGAKDGTSMSYTAIVARVLVRPHPNAQKLALGNCLGNQVVVGLDTQDGELGLYFNTDGQLGHEYCLNNDLYTASARTTLGLSEGPIGYLSEKRRVRAQKFRGECSDGLWMPLASLSWAGSIDVLKEGDTFTEFGGHQICQKYVTPATRRAIEAQTHHRRDAKCFPKHEDTKQFRFVSEEIPGDAVIYLTEKLHGTSGRLGYVCDDLSLLSWKLLINKFYPLFPTTGWAFLNGSKNVILKPADPGWYGTNDFRYAVVAGLEKRLHKGEILYFEIVGWVNDTLPIMPPHRVDTTSLKDIRECYGDTIEYTYGCPQGVQRLYVYSIVHVNEDGIVRELSWPQVVARCHELGVSHVPVLFGPTTLAHLAHIHDCPGHEALRRTVESLVEGPSTLSPAQIREGVVVRSESSHGTTYAKSKQWAFGVLEGYWKEQAESVDLEDVS